MDRKQEQADTENGKSTQQWSWPPREGPAVQTSNYIHTVHLVDGSSCSAHTFVILKLSG